MHDNKAMLNAYPDSMGGKLSEIVKLLKREEFADTFGAFYILPSLYHYDLDRGFSVIDYDINEEYADREDIEALKELGVELKLDFILNHASVSSKEFRDLLQNGDNSKYRDFFIDWNRFWAGHGSMNESGYIEPEPELIKHMFFRKPGLPILMVPFPDGKKVPYWNTFYQEVKTDENGKPVSFLGQMDLNIGSDLVWDYYRETLGKLADYGASIVRLDAFAYAPKKVGAKNFLNEPDTWELLEKIKALADVRGLELLPEIHATYEEGIYRKLADRGYMTYDFFLPGLILEAFESRSGEKLKRWADELVKNNIRTVNMLGCHDGIPLLDLNGILSDNEIEKLIDTLVKRGGYVKNLHGQKGMYYQVNSTYYSALGSDDKKLLLARAIQTFMPGKPQIWYLDLFAGENDYEAVKRAGEGGHKEINRTNLSIKDVTAKLGTPVVSEQLKLLRLRNTCKAFEIGAAFKMETDGTKLCIYREKDGEKICLEADFADNTYQIV